MNLPPAQWAAAAGDDYLDSLGLAREPFASAIEEDFYYSETQRAKCLHFLLHLAPYSDVLLLTGERGSGKSSLIQQFVTRASPTWRICALDAGEITEPRRLLEELAEVFLFDVSATLESSLGNLHKMLRTLRNSALVPVLIIDEAHQLTLPVLQLLERLVENATPEERQLCIILVGEHELETRLLGDDLRALRARVGHSFELPPFDEEETERYIRHRLAIAGMEQPALFTPARVRGIHEQSGGLPGRINEYARQMLRTSIDSASPAAAGGEQSPVSGAARKRYWRTLLGASLVLILAVVLLFQARINQWLAPAAIKPPSVRAPVVPPLVHREVPPPPVPAGPAASPGLEADTASPAQAPPAQETAAPAGAQPDVEGAAAAADRTAQEQSAPVPSPAPVEEAAPAVPQEAAPAVPQEAATAVPQRIARDGALRRQDWLRRREPSHYTLQLLAMSPAKVLGLMSGWGLDEVEAAATFYTGNDQQLLALVYGDYASREAAQQAAAGVERRFPGTRPWIRSFASIHKLLEVAAAAETPAGVGLTPGAPDHAPTSAADHVLRDEARILALAGDRYTLQLMAMDLAAVERRVRKWGMASEVLYYRTLRDDRELVAVLYGDYGSPETAQAAARQLRQRIQGISPWVRRVAAVQNAIHAFRAIRR